MIDSEKFPARHMLQILTNWTIYYYHYISWYALSTQEPSCPSSSHGLDRTSEHPLSTDWSTAIATRRHSSNGCVVCRWRIKLVDNIVRIVIRSSQDVTEPANNELSDGCAEDAWLTVTQAVRLTEHNTGPVHHVRWSRGRGTRNHRHGGLEKRPRLDVV